MDSDSCLEIAPSTTVPGCVGGSGVAVGSGVNVAVGNAVGVDVGNGVGVYVGGGVAVGEDVDVSVGDRETGSEDCVGSVSGGGGVREVASCLRANNGLGRWLA
jgi:hypothetical protein